MILGLDLHRLALGRPEVVPVQRRIGLDPGGEVDSGWGCGRCWPPRSRTGRRRRDRIAAADRGQHLLQGVVGVAVVLDGDVDLGVGGVELGGGGHDRLALDVGVAMPHRDVDDHRSMRSFPRRIRPIWPQPAPGASESRVSWQHHRSCQIARGIGIETSDLGEPDGEPVRQHQRRERLLVRLEQRRVAWNGCHRPGRRRSARSESRRCPRRPARSGRGGTPSPGMPRPMPARPRAASALPPGRGRPSSRGRGTGIVANRPGRSTAARPAPAWRRRWRA